MIDADLPLQMRASKLLRIGVRNFTPNLAIFGYEYIHMLGPGSHQQDSI
jgi:hypothetical protein